MSYKYQKSIELDYMVIALYASALSFTFWAIFRDYLYFAIPFSLLISYLYRNAKKGKVQFLEIDDEGLNFSYVDFMLKTISPKILWAETIKITVHKRVNMSSYFIFIDQHKNTYYLPDFDYDFYEVYLELLKYSQKNNPGIQWINDSFGLYKTPDAK